MCLDRRAMRSLAAWKGWETRRARITREARLKRPSPSEGWGTSKDLNRQLEVGNASDDAVGAAVSSH